MTTAKIEHRDYVPWGWFAIEFCHVEFFGDNAKELDDKWHDIEFKKYHQRRDVIEELKSKKNKIEEEIKELQRKAKELKRWYRPWKNKEERELDKCIKDKRKNIDILDLDIENNEKNMFYKASELLYKAERFLKEEGFVLTNHSSSGDECVTETDIWTKNERN